MDSGETLGLDDERCDDGGGARDDDDVLEAAAVFFCMDILDAICDKNDERNQSSYLCQVCSHE